MVVAFSGGQTATAIGEGGGGVQFVLRGPRTEMLCRGSVSFGGHRPYLDAENQGRSVEGQIKAYLQNLGARYLGPGDRLNITVLNIDLAGFDVSNRRWTELRFMNGGTPPRFVLRYRLLRGGKLIAAGEDYLTDPFYLARPGAQISTDALRFEKDMLEDWFLKKFSAGRIPTR